MAEQANRSMWRIFVAIGLLAASYVAMFYGVSYIPQVQTLVVAVSFLIGMFALCFAQDDGIKRGKPNG